MNGVYRIVPVFSSNLLNNIGIWGLYVFKPVEPRFANAILFFIELVKTLIVESRELIRLF